MNTKNKILIIFMTLLVVTSFILIPKVKNEAFENNKENNVEELYDKDGQFYVLFSREDCRYCKNIEKDISDFSKTNQVYTVNPELCENIVDYDWDKHEKEYDVEIGELSDDGSIIYYDNLTEKEVKEKYPPLNYKIVLANETYAELHDGKIADKVYAIYTHPVLSEKDFSEKDFCVPAIPMLVKFDNHKVVSYYFDDKEIIDYLKSDTMPLDKYWNLE